MAAKICLGEVAHARSGDKGNHANIGVIAFNEEGFRWLEQELTVERVQNFFAPLGASKIERFTLPGIHAFNFILYDVLAGGGSRSLRVDSQGKTLGIAILQMQLPQPPNLKKMRPD